MEFTDLLMMAAGAGAVYYLFKPSKKIETTQELLDYNDISQDGVIELPENKFRLVIEVEPINMALRSLQEQAAIWLGFKNLVNSLNLPTTFLIQTRYLNLKDYLDWLQRMSEKKPERLREYAEKHIEHLQKKTEGKYLRDRRYFIILKIDRNGLGVESGVQIENPLLDEIVKAIPKAQRMKLSASEIMKSSSDDLFEAASIIRGALDAIEIHSFVLDKKAVIELLYQTFNRDLAPFARLEEVDSQNMFSLFTVSTTPEKVLTAI